MPGRLVVLLVEDSPVDAALIERHLKHGGFEPELTRVESKAGLASALKERAWDVVICDHNLPSFSAPKALAVVKEMGVDVPFIIVSGSIDVDIAVEAMRAGAHDFLEKDDLTRLNPAIEREVAEASQRRRRREAEEALRVSEQQLRQLSARLFIAQEQERRRLAREIHDSIGQSLAAIKIRTQNVMHRIENNAPRTPETSLETIIPVIQQTIDEVRRMQTDLHPAILDDIGIRPALTSLAKGFRTTFPGVEIATKLTAKEENVPLALRGTVFRVAQEALNNATKHSGCESVQIWLHEAGGSIILNIKDDGCGFGVAKTRDAAIAAGKLGLISMRERVESTGGEFLLMSKPGQGTEVKATWPLSPDNP